jgi:tetratricopeptide (TPR) repeat protein
MSWKQYLECGAKAVWQGEFTSAEKSLKQALQFAKEHFARSDSRFPLTLSFMGHLYFRTGDFDRAEKLLAQSLKLHSEAKYLNDPCMLMDLFCLAQIKSHQGNFADACRLLDDTMDRIQTARPFQPEIISFGIGSFLQLASDFRTATAGSSMITTAAPAHEPEPALAPAAAEPTKPAKPSGPEPLPLPQMEMKESASAGDIWQQQFQTGLASMKTDDAEFDEVITAYLNFESAYRLAVGMFAPDDMRLIATIKGLADASSKLHLYDQAEGLYRQAITQAKSNIANAAAAGNSIRLALGFMYVEAGMFKSAKAIFDEENTIDLPREAEPLRKRLADAQQILKVYDQAQDLLSQAEAAEMLDDLDKAAKLANNALSQLKQAFPPQHIENAKVLRYRGRLLTRTGNKEQGEELENRAARIEKSDTAQKDEWTRRTAELPRVELDPVPV